MGSALMPTANPKSKGIVSWPQEERPRERLLSKGAQALTDSELVAIIIRVGFKGTSAVELGRDLLKQFGSLRAMVEAPVIALLEVKGLKSPVEGYADILIMPNIEAGNIFYKATTLLAKGMLAAVVTGAPFPAILTSRADDDDSKYYSIVLAAALV